MGITLVNFGLFTFSFWYKKKILLVLDNARYHHAKMLQPWLEYVFDVLELFFFPPYSPDLNAIEMLWKKTRRNVTHNRFFLSIQELCYDLNCIGDNLTDQIKNYVNCPHLFNTFIILSTHIAPVGHSSAISAETFFSFSLGSITSISKPRPEKVNPLDVL